MRVLKLTLCVILFASLLASCRKDNSNKFVSAIVLRMGTVVEITVPEQFSHEIVNLDSLISSLSDTIIWDTKNISSTTDRVEVSEITYNLLLIENNYYNLTNGHFNAAIFTVSSLYGFPDGEKGEPDQETLKRAIEKAVNGRVNLYEENDAYFAEGGGLKIDLGAFAKGWIVDQAAKYLSDRNINNFLINAGGDLYASGLKNGKPWRLGITDPDKNRPYLEAVNLTDKGLATSGTYERYFITDDGRHVSHIFDGATGATASRYISVSVIADTTELADLLSTAFYFMEADQISELCEKFDTPVLTIDPDRRRESYCGWDNYL